MKNDVATLVQAGVCPICTPKDDCMPGTLSAVDHQRMYPAGETWWYQACSSYGCNKLGCTPNYHCQWGWPSVAIDHSAVKNRVMQWLSFKYGMVGELYWNTVYAYYQCTQDSSVHNCTTGPDVWASQVNFGGNGEPFDASVHFACPPAYSVYLHVSGLSSTILL